MTTPSAHRQHTGRAVECSRSRETIKRAGDSSLTDAVATAADYGCSASHSRFFYGFRLHTLFALDGTPRALTLTSPEIDEKTVCLHMLARCHRAATSMSTAAASLRRRADLQGAKRRGKPWRTTIADRSLLAARKAP